MSKAFLLIQPYKSTRRFHLALYLALTTLRCHQMLLFIWHSLTLGLSLNAFQIVQIKAELGSAVLFIFSGQKRIFMSKSLRRKPKCLLAFVSVTFIIVPLDCQHPKGQPSHSGEPFSISEGPKLNVI